MSDTPKTVTLYQSRAANGQVRGQIAGLALTATATGFTSASKALAALRPKAGDTLVSADGKRHRVTGVAEAGDVYTFTCEAEEDP